MAEVWLSRTEAEEGRRLPRLCMQCGAPATTDIVKKYSTDAAPIPPDPIIGGCLLFPLWLAIAVIKLISWSSATALSVRTPLCDKHAHGWFTRGSLAASSITEGGIRLTGVSEEFARAWQQKEGRE